MNCPECEQEVKVLPDKPIMGFTASATTVDFNATSGSLTVLNQPVPTSEVYKCSNEKCWVTRIEVDWGQS